METDFTSESSLAFPNKSVERDLIKELVELRQLREEKKRILNSNRLLMLQLSEMEATLTEQDAHLDAKDIEILKLKNRLKKTNSPLIPSDPEIELLKNQLENHKTALKEIVAERDLLKDKLVSSKSNKHLEDTNPTHAINNRPFFYSPKIPQKKRISKTYTPSFMRVNNKSKHEDTFADHFPEEKELT